VAVLLGLSNSNLNTAAAAAAAQTSLRTDNQQTAYDAEVAQRPFTFSSSSSK
jgi:hypothetical protein